MAAVAQADIRVVALYGSPRKGGNSELLLDAFLRGLGWTEATRSAVHPRLPGVSHAEFAHPRNPDRILHLDRAFICAIPFSPCRGCIGCVKTGICVVSDSVADMQRLLLSAHIVVLSAPVFFYGLPSQAKALIDRCQSLWSRKYLLKQPMENDRNGEEGRGFLLSVAGTKGKRVFDGVRLTVRYFFDAIDVKFSDSLLYRKVTAQGEILRHPTALQEAEQLGRKSVDLCGRG
jgi:hypothetical protein